MRNRIGMSRYGRRGRDRRRPAPVFIRQPAVGMAAEFMDERVLPVADHPAHLVPLRIRRLPVSLGIVLFVDGLVLRERPAARASVPLERNLAVIPAVRIDVADAAVPGVVDQERRRDILVSHFPVDNLRDRRLEVGLDLGGIGRHRAVSAVVRPAGTEPVVHRLDDLVLVLRVIDTGPGLVGDRPAGINGEILLVGLVRLHGEQVIDGDPGAFLEKVQLVRGITVGQQGDDILLAALCLGDNPDDLVIGTPGIPQVDRTEIHDPGTRERQRLRGMLLEEAAFPIAESQGEPVGQTGRDHRDAIVLSLHEGSGQRHGIGPLIGCRTEARGISELDLSVLEIERSIACHGLPGIERHGLQGGNDRSAQAETDKRHQIEERQIVLLRRRPGRREVEPFLDTAGDGFLRRRNRNPQHDVIILAVDRIAGGRINARVGIILAQRLRRRESRGRHPVVLRREGRLGITAGRHPVHFEGVSAGPENPGLGFFKIQPGAGFGGFGHETGLDGVDGGRRGRHGVRTHFGAGDGGEGEPEAETIQFHPIRVD